MKLFSKLLVNLHLYLIFSFSVVTVRDAKHTNFVEFRNFKIVYRRYTILQHTFNSSELTLSTMMRYWQYKSLCKLVILALRIFISRQKTEKMHIESHDDCRRYAGLYFCICVDVSDNNLYYLEVRPANYNSLQL